jgi:hypothetical protein
MATRPQHSFMRNGEGKAEMQMKCKMFGQGPGLSFVICFYHINIPHDLKLLSHAPYTDNRILGPSIVLCEEGMLCLSCHSYIMPFLQFNIASHAIVFHIGSLNLQ